MPRNGSGTYTVSVNFTTEAASPPIEISKLDTQFSDVATALSASLASDGQTNPSANLPMNGFRHTGAGAAQALTDYATATDVIDQDLIYYVDSGSANAYVITPSPAISSYEEGQRFVFRATNTNTGTSTLNVNSLGTRIIYTPDGSALEAGMLINGGIYEVTYDANTSPDRWVLTSPHSATHSIAKGGTGATSASAARTALGLAIGTNVQAYDAQLADIAGMTPTDGNFIVGDGANFVLESGATARTSLGLGSLATLSSVNNGNWSGTDLAVTNGGTGSSTAAGAATNLGLGTGDSPTFTGLTLSGSSFDPGSASVTTDNDTADEVGFKGSPINSQNGNYTLLLTDAGRTIHKSSGGAGETITIPANASVAFPAGTLIGISNSGGGDLSIAITTDTLINTADGSTGTRTLADGGLAVIMKVTSTFWKISGNRLT